MVFTGGLWDQDYVNTAESFCKCRLKTSQQVGCIANHLIERQDH